jgi:hypothetical protein
MYQPPKAPLPPPCPLCQGGRVWAEPRVTGTGSSNAQFCLTYGHEKSAHFTSFKETEVAAAICLTCGFTAFYARDVLKMREALQQHPEWFDL